MKSMLRSTLIAGAVMALPTLAAANCASELGALRATYGSGSVNAVIGAAETFRTDTSCNAATVSRAMSDASGVLARFAQERLAAGDMDTAEQILRAAPGLHWAVQVTRADIAVKRGDRREAASLYNSALDTITDPAITTPNPALVPIAERITQLGQENLMLSGSLEPIVTRSGGPTGVLKSAMRGIAIEAVGKPKVAENYDKEVAYVPPAPVYEDSKKENDPYAVQPVKPVYVEAKVYVEPEKPYVEEKPYEEVKNDPYVKEEPKYIQVKKPEEYKVEDVYKTGKKEDYVIADKAAEASKAVFLPIRFAFNSSELDPVGFRAADTVADFLLKAHVKSLTLVGHTDPKGSDAYNLTLSLQRAASVRRYLQYKGVYAEIYVEGVGERHPPKLSDYNAYSDDERHAIARRVELVLHQ